MINELQFSGFKKNLVCKIRFNLEIKKNKRDNKSNFQKK